MSQKNIYTLGRGKLYLRKNSETAFKYVGATKEFKTNVSTDQLEHESLETKIKTVDATLLTKATATGSFVAESTDLKNIRNFLLGTAEAVVQEAGTVTQQPIEFPEANGLYPLGKYDVTNFKLYKNTGEKEVATTAGAENTGTMEIASVVLSENAVVGNYTLTKTADGYTLKDSENTDVAFEVSAGKITTALFEINFTGEAVATDSFTIAVTATAPVEIQSSKYELNATAGYIMPLEIEEGVTYSWSATIPAKTVQRVNAVQSLENTYFHILFLGDPARGIQQKVMGYAMIKPNGDLGFKGDEIQSMTFDLAFNKHEDYNSEVGLVYEDLGEVEIE